MTRTRRRFVFLAVLCCCPFATANETRSASQRDITSGRKETGKLPNVLLIMADDLGFSDLGCYGGEIQTPNLDGLAKNGMRFTQFYNTARCWPTRTALLTGYYAQQVRRDDLPGIKKGNRPAWGKLLPQRLSPYGYRSYHSGKWHIDGKPIKNGFARSYYLQDQGRFFYPKIHFRDDRKLPPVDPGSEFYATKAIADHAIECLQEHARDYTDQPFFHYLAFTAPHFPLHALPEDIAKYNGRYDAGWEAIRSSRWKRIQEMGLVRGRLSAVETEIGPPYHFPEALEKLGDGEVNRPLKWARLSKKQKQFQATKMAIHAAMVDRMDQEIGRVIQQVRKMNAFDNTLILFLSDNGASAEIMVRTDGHDPQAAPGSGPSYLCLGPGWSTACNTPFRRHKTWVHEGGIRTPLIAHWPAKIQGGESGGGKLNRTPGHVVDVVPTILQLANPTGQPKPVEKNQPDFPGISLVPTLGGQVAKQRKEIWWNHEGNRALRSGKWKIVAVKGDEWSLYNLESDPAETDDLAIKFPEVVTSMAAIWQERQDAFIQLHQTAGAVK